MSAEAKTSHRLEKKKKKKNQTKIQSGRDHSLSAVKGRETAAGKDRFVEAPSHHLNMAGLEVMWLWLVLLYSLFGTHHCKLELCGVATGCSVLWWSILMLKFVSNVVMSVVSQAFKLS